MKRPELLLIREGSSLGGSQPWCEHPILQELETRGFFNGGRFTFVGVYYSTAVDTTLIGYPKYLPADIQKQELPGLLRHVGLICQVVEQAGNRLDRSRFDEAYAFDFHRSQEYPQQVDRFQLASWLLQDYQVNGIYSSKRTELKRNGNGAIQWQHTIQRATPILGRDVLYLDTLHYANRQDYSQLITQLHQFILRQCGLLLQGLGQYQDLELPQGEDFQDTDLSLFIPYLSARLTTVFSDRDVRLLKALWAWCGQSAFYRRQMGVTTFDRIWEYAAKAVFGNLEDTRSGPPHYVLEDKEYLAQGDFIPDILRAYRHPPANCRVVGILDAKYYCPKADPDNGLIYGAPANSDIAKQIGYYQYTKRQYSQGDIRYTNAFLFPSWDTSQETLFKHLGYACPSRQRHEEMDRLLELEDQGAPLEEDRILLYGVRPDLLYQWCLRGEKVGDEEFYESFVKPFQEQPQNHRE